MPADPEIVPTLRPEPDLRGRWGLYMPRESRWIDVIYASEREAIDAVKIVKTVSVRHHGTIR